MPQEFCEHLEEYGTSFGRAKASYGNCLNLVDKIIENLVENELRRTLENSLDEWVLETRNLRSLFKKMVKKGKIEIIYESDLQKQGSVEPNRAKCCSCSFQIPRLEFSEFDLTDEDNPKYLGQPLPLPAGADVESNV